MITCRNCGAQSADDARDCQCCGLRIAPYSEEETRAYVQSLQPGVHGSMSEAQLPDADAPRDDAIVAICSNCLYQGSPITRTKGNFWMEVFLWSFIVPGVLYTMWRIRSRERVCPNCQRPHMIPLESPVGQRLLAHIEKSASHQQPGSPRADATDAPQ